jgi:nicotinate dehydrogenase subunit A
VSGSRTWSLTLNGRRVEVEADDNASLLHVLRHDFGLSGARFGCGVGLCGACFVLLDGNPAPACDTPMWSVDGIDVTTVEGLGEGNAPHPLQVAFLAEQAAQCGFCVSGVLVSAAALLAANPTPDEGDVVVALDRNLCRCGVQRRMVAAVLSASEGRTS